MWVVYLPYSAPIHIHQLVSIGVMQYSAIAVYYHHLHWKTEKQAIRERGEQMQYL